MATVPTITTIQKTECIGNSLVTINGNYENIKNSLTTLINTDLNVINARLDTLTTFVNSVSSAQLTKAWVSFNGTWNTQQARDATFSNRYIWKGYNVSSVYRNETGDYTVSLANPIGLNFVVISTTSPKTPLDISGEIIPPLGTDTGIVNLHYQTPYPTPGQSCRITIKDLLGNAIDTSYIHVAMFNT